MNKLFKNWGYLMISNAVSTGISFFTFILLAKKLSPEGYGIFNTLIATITLFSVFANNIVAGTVINREIVSQPKAGKHLVKRAVYLRTLGFLVASIAIVIFKYLTGKNDGIIITALIVLLLSNIVWELCEQVAFGYFVTKITTLLRISVSVVWLVFIITMPPEYASLTTVFFSYTIINLISSILYLMFDKKLLKKNDEKSDISVKQLLKMSTSYFWVRIVGTFGDQIPILLLNGYAGAAQVAYYSVGSKFVMPITLMISTGINALFPFLTKIYKEDKELFKKKVVLGFMFTLMFGSTTAAFLTLTSSSWLIYIMGESYASSVEAFNYQVWFAVCIGFDLILSMVLSSSYRQKTLAIITTIDIIIFIPILFFALPFGAKGLAIAKLVSAIISVIYHIFVALFVLKIKLNNSMFYLSCFYFVILLCASVFISNIWIKCGLYLLVIFIYILFKNSPLRMLMMLVRDKFDKIKSGGNK